MSLSGGPYIITNGLVLHLDSADIDSYPRSGSTWYDLSGYGNNTSINIASYQNGVFESVENVGYADQLQFTTPDSVSLNSAFSTISGGWSIEEWIRIDEIVYPESPAGSVVSNVAYGSSATGFDWNHGNGMGINNLRMGASSVSSSAGGTSYDVSGDISLQAEFSIFNKWYCRHMFWDRNTNQMGVYYNGKYQGYINISILSGMSLYDGSGILWGSLYGWQHHGARSIIRIYNRVLTSTEILRNYNVTKGRFGF